jgi:pimeloyl-ACP methyl ester carboxylesterase
MLEKVKVKNSKGQNIAAVINRPEKQSEKLAILCPGYLDSKDYNHLAILAEELAKRDFTVVRFDPTGTWESEGSISDYSTTQYLKDIKSVKDYILEEGSFTFILLGGHSMGGRVSLLYAQIDPNISMVLAIMSSYKKGLGVNGDKKWQIEGAQVNNRDIPGNTNENKQYLTPVSFLRDSNKYNVLDGIGKLHVPILFIAGEKDVLCPPAIVQEIFNKANEPKKFIIIPNIGHDYRKSLSEIKMVNNEIIDYLKFDQN